MQTVLLSVVDWSRAQFALTAFYHWLFVPLTLGLGLMLAIMETIYVKTGKEEWKKTTQFWMTLFGINFAIGVATGLILEFEFGTNWANYSWFVGDIFGAPLAIEGIFAFFLETTFFAVMFFGWGKVNKRFHLISTWLVAIGASLSALWILIANAWMQYPVGMQFNPQTARNEMIDFWAIVSSPVAVNKFFHTVSSAFLLSAVFVAGISSWFLLKKRAQAFALRSIKIAALFGLSSGLLLFFTGDGAAKSVAKYQPMKLAAMEGLYQGKEGAPLILFGISNPDKQLNDGKESMLFKVEIPNLLSWLSFGYTGAYVPGIENLINGDEYQNILSFADKKERGEIARMVLKEYNQALQKKDTLNINYLKRYFDTKTFEGQSFFRDYFAYYGYAQLRTPQESIPDVPLIFYSFHLMVILGVYLMLLLLVLLILGIKYDLSKYKWILRLTLFSIPLAYLATMLGWVVAEVGRQPWIIQDLMTCRAAISDVSEITVKTTFWIFAALFTVLLIVELRIMITQIKKAQAIDENVSGNDEYDE